MQPVCSMLAATFVLGLCAAAATLSVRAATPTGAAAATSAPLFPEVPWSTPNDASPTFTPDENTLVFSRGAGESRELYVSHHRDGRWSKPELAPFSGRWRDFEPAMAPDGTSLVFISNRPASSSGKPLDGYWGGETRPGRGGNLWRVSLAEGVWGTPERLPDIVNVSTATYSPAVAADGSIYLTHPDPRTHHTRLYVSRRVDGRFLPLQPLSFTDGVTSDYDPAVAPDQSFIVFSSNRPPTPSGSNGLFVAFATANGWGRPIPLPGLIGFEARLGPRSHTLYFSADSDNRIRRLPIARWLARHARVNP